VLVQVLRDPEGVEAISSNLQTTNWLKDEIASPFGLDMPFAKNHFDRLSATAQGYSTSRARNDI